MNIRPVTLTGTSVRLDPLALDHLDGLCAAGLDDELWRFSVIQVRNRTDLESYLRTALEEQAAGRSLPFTIVSLLDQTVVGCTRYGNIDPSNRRVEIGWTWVGRRWQRSAVNTEAKLLLLTHAFDTLGCMRVEFKTDQLNERSRQALRRIGAVEEGVLRRHMLTDQGRWRDSVYYSIVADEWPAVRAALRQRLAR